MNVGYITHEEATIKHFIEDPNFADLLMSEVLANGDEQEIKRFQKWYDEAKARTNASNMTYWNNVAKNAKLAVKNGYNLADIFNVLNDALATVKAAMV